MKTLHKLLIAGLFLMGSQVANAQSPDSLKTLLRQGVALNDEGKYDQAIARYEAIIKIAPKYYNAYYEKAYSLSAAGKNKEAIPVLEMAVKIKPDAGEAYNMLGNIYDDSKEAGKAIDYYKKGIKAEPDYQRLYYNLAVAYYGQQNYTDAETTIITAIKLDPKHASSHRVFAMTTNKQGRLGASLLAWCNFLLIEPQSKRSEEAVWYVKAIVNHGISRTEKNAVTITVRPGDIASMMMPMAVSNATSGKTDLSRTDSLSLQLTSLFQIAHTITADKDQPFLASYYSDFFEKLANSGNMPAFTRYIMASAAKDENLKWLNDHDTELGALDQWLKATKREF